MAKKEEDITKRIKKLEETVNKQSTQKVASLSSVLDNLEDQVDYAKQISDYQKSYEDSTQKSSKAIKEALQIEKQISEYKDLAKDYAKDHNESVRKEAETQIKILNIQKDQAKQAAKSAQTDAARNKSLHDQANTQSKMTGAQKKAQSLLDTRDKISQSIANIEKEIAETTGDNSEMVKNILKEKTKQLKNVQEINDLEIDNLTLSKDQLAAREKLAKIEKEVSDSVGKSLGFLDDMDNTIKGIPVIGGILSKALGVDDLKEKLTKDLTKQIMGMGSTFKTAFAAAGGGLSGMAGGIKSIIPMIGTMGATLYASLAPILPILLPIIAAVALFKKALDMDQEVSDMAKGLGTSREEAEHVHHELLDIASTTKVVGANAKALGESYMELAKSMGVSQIANKEMAETQVYLKNQIGMSADEASSFQKMSMAGGKSAEQNLAVIQAGVEGMTGGLMNYKEVAKDISTSSKGVQASYKGNIAALTKAVVTAKKFGMTLDQTKKSADSILDVESSLEAEMKANVLTGKNMNLNAARELALKGDTAGAMEEMMNQAGGYDELMEMAPYQQKAVADAMGMTVDEMIGAAEHQKNLNTMADELGITLDENGKMSEEDMQRAMASNNEEAKKLALQQQQASAQEKMSAMGDKLMAIFTKLATPIMEMLEPLMNLVEFIFPAISTAIDIAFFPLKIVFKTIGLIIDAWDYIFGVFGRIGAAINEYLGDPIGKIVDFVTGIGDGISNFFGGIFDKIKNGIKNLLPGWAIKLLGMDGGDAEKKSEREKKLSGDHEAAKTEVHDAHIGSDGGLIVSGGKGTYQLDENDSVIAGTNLEGGGSTPAAAPASGNAEVVALLKELIKKVDQPVNINIGGRVVQEIDRMITMNKTYNTKGDNTYGAS
jgi:hypothetical protein